MLSSEIGKVISYLPVVRYVVSIIADTLHILRTAVSQIENETKQIENVHKWLKDNDVNTFEELYDKQFNKEKNK